MGVLVKFNDVSKAMGGQLIVENFSYTLKTGEVIALLGPSGCGKTTILNLTAGLIKTTSGDIGLFSNDIGYVFQEPRLIPWKTVLENILFVPMKCTKMEKRKKAIEVLTKVGLKDCIDFYPNKLSGGMKQRVSIARALLSNPKIILMDEPFSALDLLLKKELQDDVISIIEEKEVGIIYVTHDSEEAARIADRVIILESKLCKVEKEVFLTRDRKKRDKEYIQKIKNDFQKYSNGGLKYGETI